MYNMERNVQCVDLSGRTGGRWNRTVGEQAEQLKLNLHAMAACCMALE